MWVQCCCSYGMKQRDSAKPERSKSYDIEDGKVRVARQTSKLLSDKQWCSSSDAQVSCGLLPEEIGTDYGGMFLNAFVLIRF